MLIQSHVNPKAAAWVIDSCGNNFAGEVITPRALEACIALQTGIVTCTVQSLRQGNQLSAANFESVTLHSDPASVAFALDFLSHARLLCAETFEQMLTHPNPAAFRQHFLHHVTGTKASDFVASPLTVVDAIYRLSKGRFTINTSTPNFPLSSTKVWE